MSFANQTPRQKMINLMYIVLMAMLALNVSSDVLRGFSLVDESLSHSTDNSHEQNAALYAALGEAVKQNPEKVGPWYEKAMRLRRQSDSLYMFVGDLKARISKEEADDLEVSSYVMFAPGTGKGNELTKRIDDYKSRIVAEVNDPVQKKIIEDNLTLNIHRLFEGTPAAAATTLLTKLQSDIRYAEGEVLHTLAQDIDISDLRVNSLSAYVIPSSRYVVRGSKFNARIILAAVDSTQRPAIYIAGKRLPDDAQGLYEQTCGEVGDHTLNGYMELTRKDGSVIRRDFSQQYTVIEPSATVSATLMNVLYAGYDNPVSISVPGVADSEVQASIVNGNGTLRRSGKGFIATPTTAGRDAVIRVTTTAGGQTQTMGEYSYHVRQLPDPAPFIEYRDANGNTRRYRGGSGLSKAQLMSTQGIVAAIDDGLLNINFSVLSFETVFFDSMGNVVPEVSAGANFSARQKEMFRKLSRGKRFYISRVKAKGPDGVERTLPATLEVIIN
jgi:gliding motility-associated protein GldM